MSTFNKSSKPATNSSGQQGNDKAKTGSAPSGGKPADPMLKPKPQMTPMKK